MSSKKYRQAAKTRDKHRFDEIKRHKPEVRIQIVTNLKRELRSYEKLRKYRLNAVIEATRTLWHAEYDLHLMDEMIANIKKDLDKYEQVEKEIANGN